MKSIISIIVLLGTLILPGQVFAASPLQIPHGYEHAVAMLPAAHWAMVTRVDANLPSGQGHTYSDRHIEVPNIPQPDVLIHEVGHVVALARPDLEDAYWQHVEHGQLDKHESFAEAYRATVQGRPHRATDWMREHVLRATMIATTVQSTTISQPLSLPAVPVDTRCSNGLLSSMAGSNCGILPSGFIISK